MTPIEDEAAESETGHPEAGRRETLADWRRRWERDEALPRSVRSPGIRTAVGALVRRLIGPLARVAQSDFWERQRSYNLVLQEHIERLVSVEGRMDGERQERTEALDGLAQELARIGQDLQSVQRELFSDIESTRIANGRDLRGLQEEHWKYITSHDERLSRLEELRDKGWNEVMVHSEALFSRLDQKVDRYRQLSRERWSRLGALLEVARRAGPAELGRAVDEEKYVEFERRFRGREYDIVARLEPYVEILSGRGEVLDLGCGRGEALEVLSRHGIPCRGVDSSSEMVDRCRQKGLDVVVGDLLTVLAAAEPDSLGGVVSFHVIEHLPPRDVERLVRLGWRALRPGGVLILETPSPLSLVVGARNFWIDPTHLRPVHPASLGALLDLNGFDPVERLDLQPFAADERLPDPDLAQVPAELAPLARAVSQLRDHLDGLLYGCQDFALVGYKPG